MHHTVRDGGYDRSDGVPDNIEHVLTLLTRQNLDKRPVTLVPYIQCMLLVTASHDILPISTEATLLP